MNQSPLRLVTAFLAISASLVCFASLEFMLVAIQKDFSMSADATVALAQISAGACLAVVFLAGSLADRLGDRTVMTVACIGLATGAFIVGLSSSSTVLLLGVSLTGMATITMAIVGLSVLNKIFETTADRARAFGVFAVVAPVMSITVPLLAGLIVPRAGWRSMTVLWVAVALTTLLFARRTLRCASPNRASDSQRLELFTPLLAGLALAGIGLTFSFININSRSQQHLGHAIISSIVGVTAILLLVVVIRLRSGLGSRTTLDLRWFQARGSFSIFIVVFLLFSVNLFFYTFLLMQFRYHQTLLETAVILVLPQVTAAFGAIFGGRASAKWGSSRVATTALLGAAALSFGVFFVQPESSPWVAVVVLALAAVPISGAVGPVTQSFMTLAPTDGEGAASSLRNAASNLGIAIGGVIVASIIFNDLDADTERNFAAYQQQTDAFHLAGVFCIVGYLFAAGLVAVHRSRSRAAMSPIHSVH
ncbi:MAG: MFS transporter [Acidimicrobiales bacterium]